MLDIRKIRQAPSEMEETLKKRNQNISFAELISQDDERRRLLSITEEKKALRNIVSKKIGALKRKDNNSKELLQLTEEQRTIGENITALDEKIFMLEQSINEKLLSLPNYLHTSVQVESKIISSWGKPRIFEWTPKTYQELLKDLRLCTHRLLSGKGALLARSLHYILLDSLVTNGYEEILAPQLAEFNALIFDGYHPCDDINKFHIDEQTYLSPSASVTLISMHQNQILDAKVLPASYCAFSPCFVDDAFLPLNQTHSVQTFQMTTPDQSYTQMEKSIELVGALLRHLELPYQTLLRDGASTPNKSAKTYDIQAWMPSIEKHVTIFSCSNCEDYLARRAGIRFKAHPKEKPQYLHTLSSSISIEPLLALILENNQNDDGSIRVPENLASYMKTNLIR